MADINWINKSEVLKAVKKDGMVMAQAPADIKNDIEIMAEAIKNNPNAFGFAGDKAREALQPLMEYESAIANLKGQFKQDIANISEEHQANIQRISEVMNEKISEINMQEINNLPEDASFFDMADILYPSDEQLKNIKDEIEQAKADAAAQLSTIKGGVLKSVINTEFVTTEAQKAEIQSAVGQMLEVCKKYPDEWATLHNIYKESIAESIDLNDKISRFNLPRNAGDTLRTNELYSQIALKNELNKAIGQSAILCEKYVNELKENPEKEKGIVHRFGASIKAAALSYREKKMDLARGNLETCRSLIDKKKQNIGVQVAALEGSKITNRSPEEILGIQASLDKMEKELARLEKREGKLQDVVSRQETKIDQLKGNIRDTYEKKELIEAEKDAEQTVRHSYQVFRNGQFEKVDKELFDKFDQARETNRMVEITVDEIPEKPYVGKEDADIYYKVRPNKDEPEKEEIPPVKTEVQEPDKEEQEIEIKEKVVPAAPKNEQDEKIEALTQKVEALTVQVAALTAALSIDKQEVTKTVETVKEGAGAVKSVNEKLDALETKTSVSTEKQLDKGER